MGLPMVGQTTAPGQKLIRGAVGAAGTVGAAPGLAQVGAGGLQQNAETVYGQVLNGFQNNSRLQSIQDQYAQQRGAAEQSLVSRGLGNTTVKDAVMRGLLMDQRKAIMAGLPQGAGGYSIYQSGQGGYGAGGGRTPAQQYDDHANNFMAARQMNLEEQKLQMAKAHQAEQSAMDRARFQAGLGGGNMAGGGGGGNHGSAPPPSSQGQPWNPYPQPGGGFQSITPGGGPGGAGGLYDFAGYSGRSAMAPGGGGMFGYEQSPYDARNVFGSGETFDPSMDTTGGGAQAGQYSVFGGAGEEE